MVNSLDFLRYKRYRERPLWSLVFNRGFCMVSQLITKKGSTRHNKLHIL